MFGFGKRKIREFEKGMEASAKAFGDKIEAVAKEAKERDLKFYNKVSGTLDELIDIGEEHENRLDQHEDRIERLEDAHKALKKSRLISAILCALLGWLGIHRFYCGKVISVIMYIALFIGSLVAVDTSNEIRQTIAVLMMLGLCVLIIIDFIRILLGKFKDDKNMYIKNWLWGKNTSKPTSKATEEISQNNSDRTYKNLESDKVEYDDKKDYLSKETKDYFEQNASIPRLAVGKALFDLGKRKLQIANSIIKPLLGGIDKQAYNYECTDGYAEGDMIALLGAGAKTLQSCPAVLWLICNDDDFLKNSASLHLKSSQLRINGVLPAEALVQAIVPLHKQNENAETEQNKRLDDFCNKLIDLCKQETKILERIERELVPYVKIKTEENARIADTTIDNIIGIVMEFRHTVQLPLITEDGFINPNSEKELKDFDEMIDCYVEE